MLYINKTNEKRITKLYTRFMYIHSIFKYILYLVIFPFTDTLVEQAEIFVVSDLYLLSDFFYFKDFLYTRYRFTSVQSFSGFLDSPLSFTLGSNGFPSAT